ncbi:uncharacterized protein LOC117781826 isoform X2 [Drosophila innubila]|uniref:uncharacterized protein LOC117781826 isoform X2 n=1 Tax=Drosophila innubila TaxID=198719 RepID=UPI00148D3AE4|nr:uncharacterized protein LOC117781826 isoform X2 [Drosophila innubila]
MLPGPGQQHHLRHHNRHHAAWEQRVFPALRHQQHRLSPPLPKPTTTIAPTIATALPATFNSSVTDAPHLHPLSNSSRYFDRDGIYAAWMQPRSTRAPNWQELVDSYEDDDGEDDDEDADDEDEDYEDDVDEAAAAELAKQMPRYSLFSQKLPTISSNDKDYDAYDQLDAESTASNNNNKHPSVSAGHSKAAAKRNVFDWLFKRDKEKPATLVKIQPKVEVTTEKPKSLLDDSLADEEDNDEGNVDAFSNEQWNKIEHEHHLKQQKHQKELQALRDKNKNTPLIRGGLRRGGIDNEDTDNNYARNYIPGKFTDLKNKQLGTPEAVINTRRQHDPNYALATAHWKQVTKEAVCRVPQKRCVRVENDPSKLYTPHCVQLHRCAEDSGCCHSRTDICAPKEIQEVVKVFHVKSPKSRHSVTENLTFVNHTECHCIDRSNFNAEAVITAVEVKQATILSCNCPRLFEKILQNDGQCRCDCSSSNYHCDFLKRGSEHFSMNDRKCIHQGNCKPPTCQFGTYMEKHGRCPNQHEQVSHPSSYNALNMS